MKIRVSNIDPTTTVEDLQELFEEFGEVVDVRLNEEPDRGKETYSALVEMAFAADAEEAIADLNGELFDGRSLRVVAGADTRTEAEKQRDRDLMDLTDEEGEIKRFERIQRKKPGRKDW